MSTPAVAPTVASSDQLPAEISARLKDTPEQQLVVGPIVKYLVDVGWSLDQMVFGKKEWLVPKRPSELTKREKGRKFDGFPVDIAVFDDLANVGARHAMAFTR